MPLLTRQFHSLKRLLNDRSLLIVLLGQELKRGKCLLQGKYRNVRCYLVGEQHWSALLKGYEQEQHSRHSVYPFRPILHLLSACRYPVKSK